MLVTKREVKQTSKKLLSVLLALVMMMSSMSVCFGTFTFTASAAEDYNQQLADLINANYELVENAGKGSYGSTSSRVTTLTLPTYDNYIAMRDILINLDGAIKASKQWQKTTNTTDNKDTQNCTDTKNIYNEITQTLKDYGVTVSTNVGKFLKFVLEWSGARLHADAIEGENNVAASYSSTINVKTADYRGYLTKHTGDYSAVEDSIELGYTYTFTMGRGYYAVSDDCGNKYYYHNMVWINEFPINAPSANVKDTAVKTKLNAYATYVNNQASTYTFDKMASMTPEAIEGVLSAIEIEKNTIKAYVNEGDTDNYTKLFSAVDKKIEKIKTDADSAKAIAAYSELATAAKAFTDSNSNYGVFNWGGFDEATIKADYQTYINTYYNPLKANPDVYNYFKNAGYLSDTYYTNFRDNVVAYDLEDLKIEKILPLVDKYALSFPIEGGEEIPLAEKQSAYSNLSGYINNIRSYSAQVQNAIFPESLNQYLDLQEKLECQVAGSVLYFAEHVNKDYSDAATDDIVAEIATAKSQLNALNALLNSIDYVDNETLLDGAFDNADTFIDYLYSLLAERFSNEVIAADDLYNELGRPKNLDIAAFSKMNVVMKNLEDAIYEYLVNEGEVSRISADVLAKYNALKAEFYDVYNAFLVDRGFNEFKQTDIKIYRNDDIDEIFRENADHNNDGIGDYEVTESNVEKIIDTLEAALKDEKVAVLLGNLLNKNPETGEPTGEPFDIGDLVGGLVEGIYSDALINTIIQFVYPAVSNEFIKVWATLPKFLDMKGMVISGEMTGDVYVNLYIDTVESATTGLNLPLFPSTLAAAINANYPGKYSDATSVLAQATTKARCSVDADNKAIPETIVTPWNDAVLFREVLDDNGEVVFDDNGNAKQELALDWGVDEADDKKEAFLQAASAALYGLEPLLLAILCGKEMDRYDDYVGYGEGTLNNFKLNDSITVNNGIIYGRSVNLSLKATANDGYNNVIAPLFELLGIKAPNGQNFNSVRDILEKGLLDPLQLVIDKLEANPVKTLLDILPNLAYAAEADLLLTKLNYLETTLTYSAGAVIDLDTNPSNLGGLLNTWGIGAIVSSLVEGMIEGLAEGVVWEDNIIKNFKLTDVYAGNLEVKLAEFLDIGSLLGGADLSNFAGLWSLISGLVPMLADVPAPDAAYLATLGKLVEIDTVRSKKAYTGGTAGKAYHIQANRADILQYLIKWLLESGLLNGIVENPSELIAGIFENLQNNPSNAVAAIVELLTQQTIYDAKNFTWFDGTIDGENVLGNSATAIYLNPNNDWTKDKAEYLYNNIDALVTSILTMAKLDLNKETEEIDGSIGEVIGGAIDGLLSDKTLTSLAAILAGLDLNALLAGDAEDETATVAEGEETEAPAIDVNALVKDFLGIDLAAVAAQYADIAAAREADEEYVHDFGVDAGTKTFAAALSEMLAPLSKVLDFILAGENLEITLGTEKVTLIGADGYNNGLIPLLEALGCDVTARADLGETSELEAVINALVARIDALTEGDVIKNIINLLPGVLYFITSNGLSTSVLNLLQPIVVIIDTIRPVINVMDLINNIEVGEEGAKQPLKEFLGGEIDLERLDVNFIFKLLPMLLPDLDLSGLKNVIYDVCKYIGVDYSETAKSTLQTTWKKGAYNADFDQADLLTVVLSFILEWATVEENAAKLDEMLGTDGIVASIGKVFEDVEITYGTPNWMYWFDGDEAAFEAYLANPSRINTLASIDWENIGNNDWDLDTAKYFAENIAELVDIIIGMIEINGEKYESLSVLLNDLIADNINAQTLKDLVAMITGLLGDIDENLINTVGYLLDIDLAGLKAYTCEAEIDSISDFINELANVLDTYAGGLINWLFFGDDYRFAKKSDSTDTIVINGGYGYEKGLALILEALGCELPAEANTKSVLGALATRVEAILADPVNEVLDLLPNLVYFLNANGAGVAVNNLLQPVYALLDKLSAFGLEVNLADLLKITKEDGTEIAIDLANLSLENVVTIVEGATDLPLDAAEEILVDFCTGKITKGTYIYKMEAAREDVITILLVVALELISDDAFAAKLNEMLNTDIVTGIKDIFKGSTIVYKNPDWFYMNGKENDGVIEYVNAIASYPNDWTEEKAQYLADNLPALVDTVIKMLEINGKKYDSLQTLLSELLADSNIFSTATLNSLLDLIKNLLGDIDAELLKVGFIIDVDLAGLMAYEVPADIDTVEKFAEELAYILTKYAKGAVEWLLLGRDFNLLVKDANGIEEGLVTEGSYITITGAQGYAEGLALLLEALGCENLPAADGKTEDIVTGVLTSLAARIDEILANPVEEVLDLLPNLIYFLDADGVDAVITNTTAALMALVNKLSVFGIELNINSLVDLPKLMGIADKYAEGEDKIGLDNLTLVALLRAVSLMTGLDLTELQNVLVPFALGEAKIYDSVSASDAYKMVYKTDLDKHDMLSVIVSAALRMFFAGTETSDKNAAKLDELLKTNGIVAALKDVFASVEITYATPDWNYMDGIQKDNVIEYVNAIVSYPNDWTEAKAEYLADNLPALVDTVIGMLEINGVKYESLQALLSELLADSKIFSAKTLNDLVGLITGLLGDIDASLLEAAGLLLGANIKDLKAYTASEDIDTVKEFADELANVLNTYAKGLVEWLLLGNDYTFFVKEVKNGVPVDFITINGAQGYAEGLALLLEALGCENLPAADGKTEDIVTGVLTSLAARIDEILANPVEEVLDLLPNLIYFLDADGVDAVITNTTAALMALVNKLSVFGIELNINSLVDLPKLMGIADKYAEGEDKIGLDNLTLVALLRAVSLMTGLDLTELQNVLVPFALGEAVKYDSVSASDAYKMVYKTDLDKHDMLSVIVTAALKVVVENEGNAAKLDEMLGTNIVSALKKVFEGSEIIYTTPNWDYCWDESDEIYDWGNIPVIESAITYPNDWTEEKAQYLAENLPALVDTAIGMIEIDGVKYDSLSDLLKAKVNVFTTENLQAIVDLIANLLKDIDDGLLEAAGVLLGADIVGLKAYKAPEGITTVEEFAEELANVLNTYAKGVVEWLLLGNDYTFFVKEVDENGLPVDFITLNGAQGYAEGLALLLEALGCENLPEVYGTTATTEEIVSGVLASLAARIDKIFANPVKEIVNLLPNLIYFLNTNGVAAVIDNTTAAITALAGKLAAFGVNLDLNELVNLKNLMKIEDTDATISLDNLSMKDILQAVSLMTDLDLTVLEDILVGFAMGHCAVYESVSEASYETFKMVYETDFENHDMITVLVTAVLLVAVENGDNAAKLDKMLGTEIISALKDVFASVEILYTAPNWNYPLADNGTVDAMKYSITYPNNWTEATAEAVTEFLLSDDFDTLITGLIDKNYATLSDLLKAKVNVFTTENLQAIVDLIADLLKDIDDGLLEAAGVLLGADVVGLKAYKAPAGITTVDAFAKELANVLNTYAKGVVEWLLLGNDYTFFIKDVEIVDEENKIPVDFITINGAHGYAEGLALLLEALGCKNLPAVYGATATTEEIVTGVLASLAARINEIFADPVNEIVDLLPNLFYFLNTNGVAAVVDNTLAAVTALLEKLSVFGLNVYLNELVNLKKLMKIEDTDATISLDNLSMADLLQAVSYMIEDLDITYIKDILVGFALGKVEAYTSVSKEVGETKKMVYADEFDKHDLVTVVANLALLVLADEANAEFVKGLVGEDIYAVIIDILNLSTNEVPVKYMNWQGVPDKVGQIFNALETSPNYKGFEYGPLYTEEMAQYIADNIGEFINNIIYLLGLEINGENVDSLEDLLDNLVGGSLYNSDLVITIRDALAGLAGSIEGLEVEGKNVGKLIVKVLAAAEIADLKAIGKVDVPAFEDNREMFVESLCNVLEPAYGLLTWLLADEDLAFFVDLENNDFITLPGADGYRNGIALLLEAIGCEDLPAELNGEGDAVVKAILNPLLNRLDEIFANPAEEILAVLTNVIYFINSNGVDVVIKNTLNAVYTVLAAIEPVAKVDLYELVGLDAYVTLSAEELIDMLLSKLEVAGFDFTAISVDFFSELTVGKLEAYDSISDQLAAYRMVYDAEYANEADMITAVMRLVITFILTENNREVLINLLKTELGMSADAEKYVRALINSFADVVVGKEGEDLRLGMDTVLATIYYIFYGLDIGVGETADGKKEVSELWKKKLEELNKNASSDETKVGDLITDILDIIFNDEGKVPEGGGNDVLDQNGVASNGFLAFFARIKAFFQEIADFFRNLFSFGR